MPVISGAATSLAFCVLAFSSVERHCLCVLLVSLVVLHVSVKNENEMKNTSDCFQQQRIKTSLRWPLCDVLLKFLPE